MALALRSATPSDVPAILAIEQATASAAHWAATQYENLVRCGFLQVAEEDGQLSGFACAKQIAGEWELENIVVAVGSRRRGIADALLAALLDKVRGKRGTAVFLEVRESNLAAQRLYEKHGFLKSGRRKDYYREPVEDAVVYQFRFGNA